jgi:hypothetical protein
MKVNKLVLSLLVAGLSAGFLSGAQAADADRIKALEDQLHMLQQAIAELKNTTPTKKEIADLSDQVTLQGKEAVVLGDIPNSFRMPGSDTSVRLYGYAEANLIHDMGSSVPGDYFSQLQFQPLKKDSPSTGNTRMTVQTTRFGVETSTPTPIGPFNTKFEADFFGNAQTPSKDTNGVSNNSALLRLRHAYGEYAGFLIGQTWSTFMDGDNMPETADFNGPPGVTFSRPVQIRYTYQVPNVAKFQVALENPTTGSSNLTNTHAQAPSLVLRADKAFDFGAVSLRAVRHTEMDESTGISASGTGFGISGSYKFTETLTGFGQYTRADSDIWGALVVGANGTAVIGNELVMDKSRGVVLGLSNVFNPQWRTTLAYGQTESQFNAGDAFAAASTSTGVNNKNVKQWHLNVYYTPIKNVDLGAELVQGTRTTFAGDTGDLNRFNLQARYTFN